MLAVRIKIDAREIALAACGVLMALKEKVRSIVVARVSAMQATQHEIGVLVRFSLRRFNRCTRAGQCARCRDVRTIAAVAIELESCCRILETQRAFSDSTLPQLR